MNDATPDDGSSLHEPLHEPRLWRDNGWTARVIKNEDDDGWAVAMYLDGHEEPALVGPWTMGRDKKNPKPLDTSAFNTLVKTAHEVIRRHEQSQYALLHKELVVRTPEARLVVTLDITPSEDEPYATLAARDGAGALLGEARVEANYKLTTEKAEAWIEGGFGKPPR